MARSISSSITLFLFIFLFISDTSAQDLWKSKIEGGLMEIIQENPSLSYIVQLKEQANPKQLKLNNLTKVEKGNACYQYLRKTHTSSQSRIISFLKNNDVSFHPFIIVNAIKITGHPELMHALAKFEETDKIIADPLLKLSNYGISKTKEIRGPGDPEWGILKIEADKVWDMGYRGQGVIIAGQDTGYDWDQPVLKNKYRGWDGSNADHNYHWHDAIHELNPLHNDTINEPFVNPCGLDSPEPCDDNNHGTHTMGTMVGEDEENKIGVAPEAKWIACRNMDRGYGKPSTYIECFEFFLAPTDLNGNNPDVSKAPHVINNSWRCPELEGCNSSNWELMNTAVENLRASGIVVVVSAGNTGNACESVDAAAAMLSGSFTVGATASSDSIAGFSSRGNVAIDGSFRLKPNVSAPGVQVRSIKPDSTFASWNGTSMAGPHVAGAVALIISANPSLAGKVNIIEDILEQTAEQKTSDQDCSGVSGYDIPNPIYGFGRINVFEAVNLALNYNQTENLIDDTGFIIYPNPIESDLHLHIKGMPGSKEIQIFNSAGSIVHQELLNTSFQFEQKHINISKLPSGLYFCTLKYETKFYTQKLVKQ